MEEDAIFSRKFTENTPEKASNEDDDSFEEMDFGDLDQKPSSTNVGEVAKSSKRKKRNRKRKWMTYTQFTVSCRRK